MYFRPYIDFSAHTPYFSATVWSSSARSGKPRPYFSSKRFCFAGGSGLMPSTTAFSFFKFGIASRRLHDCCVQPVVSAFG